MDFEQKYQEDPGMNRVIGPSKLYFLYWSKFEVDYCFYSPHFLISFILRLQTSTSTKKLQLLSLEKYH